MIFTSNHLFVSISRESFVAFSQALSLSKQRYILFVSLFIIVRCFSVRAVHDTATVF
jgi:hypothetical protein